MDSSVGVHACWSRAALDKFQIINAHSSFIDNTMWTSTFSKFGMPVDNLFSDSTSTISSG